MGVLRVVFSDVFSHHAGMDILKSKVVLARSTKKAQVGQIVSIRVAANLTLPMTLKCHLEGGTEQQLAELRLGAVRQVYTWRL